MKFILKPCLSLLIVAMVTIVIATPSPHNNEGIGEGQEGIGSECRAIALVYVAYVALVAVVAGVQWTVGLLRGMGCNDVEDLYVRQSLLLCFSMFCLSPLKAQWSIIKCWGKSEAGSDW
ncbi:hypothetical protein EDD18DRAFT_1333677 [Armillaria luteobubalina]|uniref:Hydrophobin n=1 Tax=Armillaria luteobubalina TaxID=153913 RepID=A0AA39UKL8_9AGAR|nr:hypothetical protein EDD18DRAFT_1333677 [Armillaria luteobubalina]